MYLIYMPILSPSRKFQAALVATSVVALVLVPVTSASAKSQNSQHERVVSYWTPENMASAQSLDYTFDVDARDQSNQAGEHCCNRVQSHLNRCFLG